MNVLMVELYERARRRQHGLALPWAPSEVATLTPETIIDCLVENGISVVDRLFTLNETYMRAEVEYEQEDQRVQRLIIDEKAATRRAILALETATEAFAQAIEEYAAEIDRHIQDARRIAADIENRQLRILETARTELAEDKAEAQIREYDGRILLETIERSFVELEIARIELDVQRGYVRQLLAEIDVTRAELQIVKSEIEQAMVQVRAADIRATIATIFAEILTKELIKTRYEVTRAEIEAGFAFIQERLLAMLELSGIRRAREIFQRTIEETFQVALGEGKEIEKAEDRLRRTATLAEERVLAHEKDVTETGLIEEETKKGQLYDAEKDAVANPVDGSLRDDLNEMEVRTDITKAIERAEKAVTKQRWLTSYTDAYIEEYLRKETV